MRPGGDGYGDAGGDHVRARATSSRRTAVDEHIAIADVAEAAEIYATATLTLLR